MTGQNFKVINEEFTCEYCHKHVTKLKTGCRNHCPHCLSSKHVDVMPGDRACECHGQLQAYDYDLTSNKGLVLLFKCRRCGEERRNKAALDDMQLPDNYDKILSLKKF